MKISKKHRKFIIIFVYLLLHISFACLTGGQIYSQSGWFWQNPLPQGNFLLDIIWPSSENIYAVGYAGCIMKSTNSGLNWVFQEAPISYAYMSTYFVNENTGFTSSSTAIVKTTNGGENWFFTFPENEYRTISKINFLNDLTGFAVGALYTGLPPTYFNGLISPNYKWGNQLVLLV